MLLDTSKKSIEILLGEAKTTSEVEIIAHYEDRDNQDRLYPITQTSLSNGVAASTIISPPKDNTARRVKDITIYNADTVQHVVTIRLNETADTRRMLRVTMGAGQTQEYTEDRGWFTPNSSYLNSPAFSGTPTAPTPARGDVSLRLATTEFVNKPFGVFCAMKQAATQNVVTAVWSRVILDHVLFDSEAAWSAANNWYVAPKTGQYLISSSVTITSTGNLDATAAQASLISKNADVIVGPASNFISESFIYGPALSNTLISICTPPFTAFLVAGDTIRLNASVTSAGTPQIAAQASDRFSTGMTIRWVSV